MEEEEKKTCGILLRLLGGPASLVTAWQPNKEEANLPQRLSRQPHSLTALQKFRRQAREGSSKRSCTGCTFRVASDLACASNAVI